MQYQAAYEALLGSVSKPGRYLGGERGMVRKDPSRVELRFALAFPEVYEIAQSHPGLQILYDILNRRSDVYAERVYAPWTDMEAALRAARLPLVSLETFSPLSNFNIVGFTLQYELTYTNVLAMLDLGGIALRSSERNADAPLVVAGGPCAFNPEPLADFLDAVLLGDGEEAIHDLCDVYLAWNRRDRNQLLTALAGIRGVYIPSLFRPTYTASGKLSHIIGAKEGYDVVEKRVLQDLNSVRPPTSFIVPSVQIVHDRPSLEVMRGCVKGCRFCQAGYIYRPLRERDPRAVLEQAEQAIRETGHDEVSLLSLSTGDYSCVNPLLTELMNRFSDRRVAVSLPSTRVDALAPSLLDQIKRVRKTGFTLAPEAGSQRLRDVIQKEYQEGELVAAAQQIFALGWRSLKLYFMIGLPSENEDDVMGIVDLAAKVAAVGRGREIVASVSNFVPKPHTPFQWAPQLPIPEIEQRQQLLRKELAKRRIRFRYHDPRLSYLEGVFSRGDRRTGAALQRAYELGCRFDGWNDACRFDLWQQAFKETGIIPDFYLRRRTLDEVLPWDHLSSGVTKAFLQRELAMAFERTLTPDCSVERCTYCGACDFTTIRNVDYHIDGSKAAEHRGELIDHWASEIVAEATNSAAWEPRGWQKIQARKRGEGEAPAQSATTFRTAAPLHPPVAGIEDDGGLGNAEEWLAAAGESMLPPDQRPMMRAKTRVVLQYEKVGRARFIGNLELTTVFHRAARRAQLPVAFSHGHHPMPRFAFGPALPLGSESDCEFVEVELTEDASAETVAVALNSQFPEGLRILSAIEPPRPAASVASRMTAFRYRIDLGFVVAQRQLDDPIDKVAAFLRTDRFELRKHAKGEYRMIDARPFVTDIGFEAEDSLIATITFDHRGTLKPADLVAAILGLTENEKNQLRIRKLYTHFDGPVHTHEACAVADGV